MNSPDSLMISKVLIVDDHVLFREGLISLFSTIPEFEVVGGGGTVHEGIVMAHELRPDIILMDFSLPDGTGLDATRAILSELPDCKIVFLTVHEKDEDLFTALRVGAKGYMLKNIPSTDLIAGLQALNRGEVALSRHMVSLVLDEFARMPSSSKENLELVSELSPREMDVLRELETGASNKKIAQRLYLSENTVKHHIRNVFSKLGVKNRRQAAAIARQLGLKRNFSGDGNRN